jgi:putative Holliday junction resolvase
MGVDLGSKTIGLALSDATLAIATALETLKRKHFSGDAAALAKLVAARGVGALVFGLPRNMDGSEGPRCQATRDFARELARRSPLPYAFWDERLSTAAVERVLIGEADLSRRRRAESVDRAAAAYILQGALEFLKTRRRVTATD